MSDITKTGEWVRPSDYLPKQYGNYLTCLQKREEVSIYFKVLSFVPENDAWIDWTNEGRPLDRKIDILCWQTIGNPIFIIQESNDKKLRKDPDFLIDYIPNNLVNFLEEKTGKSLERKKIAEAFLSVLNAREKIIIERRFGFFEAPQELEKVKKPFGVTRERIRQLETKALRKMRRHLGEQIEEEESPLQDIELHE